MSLHRSDLLFLDRLELHHVVGLLLPELAALLLPLEFLQPLLFNLRCNLTDHVLRVCDDGTAALFLVASL